MKKVLLLLITLIALLSVPQTAEAWGWMKIRGNFDGWSEAGATLTVDPNDDSHYTGTLTVAPDKIATLKSDGLWFRLVEQYTNNVGPTANGTVYTLGSAAEGKENGGTENCWTMTYDGTIKYNVDVRWKEDGGNRRFETTLTAVADDPALRTIYFLTPFTDRNVKLWAWGNYSEEEIFNIPNVDWETRPAMTDTGETEQRDGTTYHKYSYTFAKVPSNIIITDGGELKVYDGAAFEYGKTYVYEKTTRTVKIVNDQPWDNVYAYTWDWDGQTGGADAGKKFGAWPGAKLNGYDSSIGSLAVAESVQDNVTTYTMTVSDYLRNWSDKLIISNGDDKQKTVSLANGSEYHTVPDQTFTVYFKNTGGWTKVYAYTHGPETEGAFPGTEAALVDATEQIYSWSYSGWLPQEVIFSGGTGGAEGTYQRTVNVRGSENNGKTFQLDGTEVPVSGSGDSSELAPKSEDAGHDVIYQMNIGSFTAAGTFAAATSELTNLKAKGIDIIWVMPIFKRDGGSNSPYAATTYEEYQYGTAAEFSTFVSTAHTLGMKVWLDWAANHNSTQHPWHNTHTEYYAKSNGNYINPVGGGITYADVHQLDLRDKNPDAQDAMIAEMKKFVDGTYTTSGAAIDGFRCDMVTGYGNYLPKSFWSKAISELREVKPELKFLAETDIHNHTQDSLATCGFDFDYAWNFHDELAKAGASATAVKAAADKAATEGFRHMFYLTNHDVNNGKSMTEEFGQRAYPLTVMEFTLPGMPLLYNGQENGYLLNNKLNYFTDSDVDWTYHNYKMENTVKALINLKRSNPALADGNAGGIYMPLNSYSNYEGKTKSDQIVSYARRLGKKWVLVVLNVSDQQATATVDDVITGNWSCVIDSRYIAFGGTTPTTQEVAEDLSLTLTLEPNGYRVYTLDADETDYQAGYYLRYNGHWNRTDTTKPLRKVENGSAVQDGIYTLVIDAEDFDDYRAADDKVDGTDVIYFKLKEFYEYLGSVITNPNDILRPLKESSPNVWDTPDPEFTPESGDKSPLWEACTNDNQKAFYFKKTEGVKRYIISLKRIREPQYDEQGQWKEDKFNTTVNVNFVYDLEKTFKLHHYESTTQGGYVVKNDQMVKVGDEGFDELAGADQDYHYVFRIKAEDFDKYSNKDFYDRVFFAFYEPQTGGEDYEHYVAPTTTGNGRLISEESNIDNAAQYISGIDIETDIAKFRKDAYYIIKQADVKEYIIKLRKNEGDNNYTVKVEFRKTSAFPGHSVDDVLGEKVYLYNVGAQKFIIPTGAWGTEAGLLYNDLGMAMKISKNGARYTLQTIVATDWGAQLGVDEGHQQIRIYVDRNNGSQWAFEEVPGMDNTYRLALNNQKKGGDVYIYAGNTVISNDGNDGLSQDVPITERNDEVCFTREPDQITNGDMKLEKYFQWKIVTYQELLDLWKGRGNSNEVYGGTDVDGTFMLNDYEFARGNTEQWTQEPNGMFKKNALGDRKLTGKLFHARIMNNGTMSQTARCYAGGVYRFRCNGFTNMNQNGHVYMYAEVPGQTVRKQDLARATKAYQTDGYQARAITLDDCGGDEAMYNLYKNQGRTADDILAGLDFFNNEYVNDYYFYVPQSLIEASTTSDEAGDKYVEITIGFEITGGTNVSSDYTAIDKVRLHYLGKSPFVLSDTKTEESQYTYTDGEDDAQFPIYLQREFWDKQWNPLLLPVTLSAAQVRSAFGERTQVAAANGLDPNNPYKIMFKDVPLNDGAPVIEAGKFYMIRPDGPNYGENVQMVDAEGNTYTITGKSLNLGHHKQSEVKENLKAGTDGKIVSNVFAPGDAFSEHNSIRYTGSYFKQQTAGKAYVFGYNKTEDKVQLYHMVNSQQVSLNGFRFYINDVNASGTEYDSDALGGEGLARLFSGFELRWDNDEATGITANTIRSEQTAKGNSHVYNLQGQMVAKDASLLNTLPSGVYIVNGKKIIVK